MSKETVKIAIVGHVDHGKSTLIGRLLYETNSLPKGKISEIKKISKELGKEAELAYLTDQLREERERNLTIDTAQIFFRTRKRDFVIIDTPGHVEFLKNMMTGASLAQAGVLIVDVNEGVMEQTRRHAYLLKMLGLKNVIVVFNKMDLVDYQRNRFEAIKTELLKFFESLAVKPDLLIPASAKEGDNISKRSPRLGWYKGPTLLEALDRIKVKNKSEKRPLRFPIQDIYEIDGERIFVGKVASGELKAGEGVNILPSRKDSKVLSIKVFGNRREKASAGENIGLILNVNTLAKRGDVIVQKNDPAAPLDSFKGNVFWMSDEPLLVNKPVSLRCATQEVECIAEKIENRMDSSTLEIIEENAKELKLNEVAAVSFKTSKPIVTEKFPFIEELGRFVLERDHDLIGAGIRTCD